MIGDEGVGALIYLPQEGRGIGLIEKIRAYNLQDRGWTPSRPTWRSATAPTRATTASASRSSRTWASRRVRLLTNNPKKTDAFVYYGYDLQVVDQVPIIAPEVEERRRYLDAKRDKMGHLLPHAGTAPTTGPARREHQAGLK